MHHNEMQAKIDKLPQWTQRYISKLLRDIDDLKRERATVQDGDSGVYWETYFQGERYYIPGNVPIVFELTGGVIECTRLVGGLYIRSREMGEIVIVPSAANRIRVELRK